MEGDCSTELKNPGQLSSLYFYMITFNPCPRILRQRCWQILRIPFTDFRLGMLKVCHRFFLKHRS